MQKKAPSWRTVLHFVSRPNRNIVHSCEIRAVCVCLCVRECFSTGGRDNVFCGCSDIRPGPHMHALTHLMLCWPIPPGVSVVLQSRRAAVHEQCIKHQQQQEKKQKNKKTNKTPHFDRCGQQKKETRILLCATFDVKRLHPWIWTACCVVALTALLLRWQQPWCHSPRLIPRGSSCIWLRVIPLTMPC